MNRRIHALIRAAALLLLLGALIAFNLPHEDANAPLSPTPIEDFETDAPPGHEPGQRLPDFSLTTLNGDTFTLSAQRGKVTVVNLWATWCAPCIRELRWFDALQTAHPDDVSVIAIHSDLITDDPAEYLSAFDYGIAFAVDGDGSVINALGGSAMLPQTVIINARGIVTYNGVGSQTYEGLEELVSQAMTPD